MALDRRRPARPQRHDRDQEATDYVPADVIYDDDPDDVDDVDDIEEGTPADAQEYEAQGHYVTAELCGERVRIIPPGAWRQSWMRLLNAGAIDDFADQVIHPDDLELYDEIDPTNNEFGEFVGEAASRAGEGLGKSPGPGRSSRRTRRR